MLSQNFDYFGGLVLDIGVIHLDVKLEHEFLLAQSNDSVDQHNGQEGCFTLGGLAVEALELGRIQFEPRHRRFSFLEVPNVFSGRLTLLLLESHSVTTFSSDGRTINFWLPYGLVSAAFLIHLFILLYI